MISRATRNVSGRPESWSIVLRNVGESAFHGGLNAVGWNYVPSLHLDAAAEWTPRKIFALIVSPRLATADVRSPEWELVADLSVDLVRARTETGTSYAPQSLHARPPTDPMRPLSKAVWASGSPLLSNAVLFSRLPQSLSAAFGQINSRENRASRPVACIL